VPSPLQLVVFSLDDRRYAIHLSAVERTVRMVEITPLPKAPEVVHGVINVQGRIIPVLNIRKRFRLPEREPCLGDQLIIAATVNRSVALVADAVSDVTLVAAEETTAPAEILPHLEYVRGVAMLDGNMVFIHDLDAFLSLEEEQALETAIGAEN
jgi:purine-binding chemotaxis protein CheW